jgi:endonuclease/exonuclease/phosphatase family metal-dependent hydrolase
MRRVRVVSWNVGRLYTPSNNNRLDDADIPQVARTLHELDPDVILLQELVDRGQLTGLLARLKGYAGELAAECRYDRHVAALVRVGLEPAFEQHVLEPTGRGLVAATFALPGGRRGAAHPLHFDVFDKRRRRSQAVAIAALTDERTEALQVVGGDFNLDPDWAAKLEDPLDIGTFGLLAERFTDGGRAAGPTLLGFLRVDHLLVRGPIVKRLYTRVSPERRLPMGDHDPLVCDVELAVDAARLSP